MTAVGATHQVNPEVAISFSGGGFSRVFPRPSYQAAAVATFLTALGTTNAGLFKYVSLRKFSMPYQPLTTVLLDVVIQMS